MNNNKNKKIINKNDVTPLSSFPTDGKDSLFETLYRLFVLAEEVEEFKGEKHLDIYYREVIKPWLDTDFVYHSIARHIKHKFKNDSRPLSEIFEIVKEEIENYDNSTKTTREKENYSSQQ